MNLLICEAISQMRLLDFYYDNNHRIVEPHAYGINDKGHQVLRCFQVGGSSNSHKAPYWRLFLENDMRELNITQQKFSSARPGYKRNDKNMVRIFSQL
jgi:hypothetical protein